MRLTSLDIPGSALIDAEPFTDSRGVFARWFCDQDLSEFLGGRRIVNVNFSRTVAIGSVRGMHFQYSPMAEMKLVRCIKGSVYDVMLDLRKDSPTFLHWHGETLSSKNMRMVIIPEGIAHGFQTLEQDAEMLYLHTEYYSPKHDSGVRYDDPMADIRWPIPVSEVSEKDRSFEFLCDGFEGLDL